MAPKKGSDSEGPQGLSSNELRFIKAVFDNMTQKPDANWDKVAADLKLKDAKCAKERFRQMSVRHGWREQQASSSSGAAPRRGRAAATGAGVKKRRAPPKKKVKKEESESEAEAEDETREQESKSDEDDEL